MKNVCLSQLKWNKLPVMLAALSLWSVEVSAQVGRCDVMALAAGTRHSLALLADGTVWAWGENTWGQLGLADRTDQEIAQQVAGLSDITAIAAGGWHSLALTSDGRVMAWGSHVFGELGSDAVDPQTAFRVTPMEVPDPTTGLPLTDITAIAAGSHHCLALRSNGTVVAWGYNAAGQLGDGTATSSDTIVDVIDLTGASLTDVKAIAAGHAHSLALLGNGEVYSWGYNAKDQLARTSTPTPTNRAGKITSLGGVKAIAAAVGGNHSLALLADGRVQGWGWNERGQLGDTTTLDTSPGSRPPSAVQKALGGDLDGVKSIAVGGRHSLAITSDGHVWAWGSGANGQLGNGGTLDQLAAVEAVYSPSGLKIAGASVIAAGGMHSLAFQASDQVRGWGLNDRGQLGDGTKDQRNQAVKWDSTNVGCDTCPPLPSCAPCLTSVVDVAAGGVHSVALTGQGGVWSWGDNSRGQMGLGASAFGSSCSVPVPARDDAVTDTDLFGIIAVAAGSSHTLALRSDGGVWAWGSNLFGQLGTGTSTDAALRQEVRVSSAVPLLEVIAIAAGDEHSLALKSDGTVWAWGRNDNGQLGIGSVVDEPWATAVSVPPSFLAIGVAGGGAHSLVIRDNGQVWGWGSNQYGQIGYGACTPIPCTSTSPMLVTAFPSTALDGATVLAGGGFHSLAVQANGSVQSWGFNPFGQLGRVIPGFWNENPAPVAFLPGELMTHVGAGYLHSLAVQNEVANTGRARSWGWNTAGQLGDDNWPTEQYFPVDVLDDTTPFPHDPIVRVTQVAGGYMHSLARRSQGEVVAFGDNTYGQLGVGSTGGVSPIATAISIDPPAPNMGNVLLAVKSGAPFEDVILEFQVGAPPDMCFWQVTRDVLKQLVGTTLRPGVGVLEAVPSYVDVLAIPPPAPPLYFYKVGALSPICKAAGPINP